MDILFGSESRREDSSSFVWNLVIENLAHFHLFIVFLILANLLHCKNGSYPHITFFTVHKSDPSRHTLHNVLSSTVFFSNNQCWNGYLIPQILEIQQTVFSIINPSLSFFGTKSLSISEWSLETTDFEVIKEFMIICMVFHPIPQTFSTFNNKVSSISLELVLVSAGIIKNLFIIIDGWPKFMVFVRNY